MNAARVIQVLLIVVDASPSPGGCSLGSARAQAIRRIGLVALRGLRRLVDPRPRASGPDAPGWSGIGRGADLVLYGLVVAFFSFVVTTYQRFRDMETDYTRLARRIALDEAAPATEHVQARQQARLTHWRGEIPPSPSVKAADAD